eukprot:6066281-Prymnesium_polylepis.1
MPPGSQIKICVHCADRFIKPSQENSASMKIQRRRVTRAQEPNLTMLDGHLMTRSGSDDEQCKLSNAVDLVGQGPC